ncbi:MAG TPA: hypothetical protein VHM19_09590, partial [Polyangiales bacterium]|nr:hypothetical protein [Polyangiales bacterium]
MTTAIVGLFGLLLLGAPMLLGGVMPWAVVAITAAALACLGAALWLSRSTRRKTPYVALAFFAAAVWTSVQAMPLPCGLVSWIAPDSAKAALAAQAMLGATPATAYCSISRDPGETLAQILNGVAICATFLGTWLLCIHVGRRRVLTLIAASSLVMSIVALAHAAFGWNEVFGLYEPTEVKREILLAPLINMNNLG